MYFDIIFGIIVFLSAIRGAINGLVRQAFVLMRVVVSVVGAVVLAPYFSSLMLQFASNSHLSWWMAFLLVFFGIWFFVFCLGLSFSGFLKTVEVTGLDRLVGFVVGALCGFLVCMIMTMFLISQSFVDIMKLSEGSYILRAFDFYAGQIRCHGLGNIDSAKECLKIL